MVGRVDGWLRRAWFMWGLDVPSNEHLTEINFLQAADWHVGAPRDLLLRLGAAAPPALVANESKQRFQGSCMRTLGRICGLGNATSATQLIYIGAVGTAGVKRHLRFFAQHFVTRYWPQGVPYAIIVAPWDPLASILASSTWLSRLLQDPLCLSVWMTNLPWVHPKIHVRPLGVHENFAAGLSQLLEGTQAANAGQTRVHQSMELRGDNVKWLIGAHSVVTNPRERGPLKTIRSRDWDFCEWRWSGSVAFWHGPRWKDYAPNNHAIRSRQIDAIAEFYRDLVQHAFVLAPGGAMHGMESELQQSYRFWEALYLGVVPIVRLRQRASFQ